MKHSECAYCGEQRELTRDHVPPRCLFSKPRPDNLITVPCCNSCNKNLQKHDEYFRLMITLGIDPINFPQEFSDSIRAINSLSRLTSLDFARNLLRRYEAEPARMTIDSNRIGIVLHRIVRGLFYHHSGVRLPGAIPFDFCQVEHPLNLPASARELVGRLEGKLNTIGPGTFRFAYEFQSSSGSDPFDTIWLMRFYDQRSFLCATETNDPVHFSE